MILSQRMSQRRPPTVQVVPDVVAQVAGIGNVDRRDGDLRGQCDGDIQLGFPAPVDGGLADTGATGHGVDR